MNLIGALVQQSIKLGKTPEYPTDPTGNQEEQLRKLLLKARKTAFGRHHNFDQILQHYDIVKSFASAVPLTDYDTFYQKWWRLALADEPDVTWPGKIPFFALSSGTSGASSKYIPVTSDMLREMKKVSRRMFFDLAKYHLPARQFTRQMLMVGSGTTLRAEGKHLTGDLSGILGLNRPVWLEPYYRPGRHITGLPEWRDRIEAIANEAPQWNIGFAVSNPMWLQLIFERMLEKHNLQSVHDIWPDFNLLVHGGVFFEPYRQGLEQLFSKKVHYIDSYMASEGFFAYQNHPHDRDLQLVTDGGIYYEFVPFTPENFDEEGNLTPEAKALPLHKIEKNQHYALLISTPAGAWRYLLGDTIQFTNTERLTFRISGRTKQFLSVCGEHLSLDNINEAVRRADLSLNAGVREFVAGGIRHGSGWAHRWWFSAANASVSAEMLMNAVDAQLKLLNDDYAVEREYALKTVAATIIPNEVFLQWLHRKGKFNGQAKIPRVMKGEVLEDWANFVTQQTAVSWSNASAF